MFFSIIIPVYNVERYIRQSVDSVLGQNESDIEIILVDDGSTDSSGPICDEYQSKYPNVIRVIHKNNEGLLFTRRCGIRAAKGDYLVHLDSDDYMMPGALSAIRDAIEKHHADLVICKIAYGAQDGEGIDFYSRLPFENEQVFEGEDKQLLYRQLLAGGYMTAIFQKIARRDTVDVEADYSRFDRVSQAEDHLQSMPLLQNCTKAVFLDYPIIYYRYNAASITKKKDVNSFVRNIHSLLDVYDEEIKYYRLWDFSEGLVSGIVANHGRMLCVQLSKMILAANKEDNNTIKGLIAELQSDPTWKTVFRLSDKQRLGRFSRLCYLMVQSNQTGLLKLLCKYF